MTSLETDCSLKIDHSPSSDQSVLRLTAVSLETEKCPSWPMSWPSQSQDWQAQHWWPKLWLAPLKIVALYSHNNKTTTTTTTTTTTNKLNQVAKRMNDFNESKPVEAQDSYLDSLPNEMKEEAKKKFNMICFGCTFSGEDRASFKERGICLCGKRFVLPLSNCILGAWKCSAETWGSPSANFVE